MKPVIMFKCTNDSCPAYGRDIRLRDSFFLGSGHCRKCFRKGEVSIQHGGRTFSDPDAFGEYLVGLAKEVQLLKKLVDRGVAEKAEKEQFAEKVQLLSEVKCPSCGRHLLDTLEPKKGKRGSTS